jgi:hypothetical protein
MSMSRDMNLAVKENLVTEVERLNNERHTLGMCQLQVVTGTANPRRNSWSFESWLLSGRGFVLRVQHVLGWWYVGCWMVNY